jgi:hypothetical protein
MKRLCLALAVAGALALGAFETSGFAADFAAPEPTLRHIRAPRHVRTHWRVAKRVAVPRCIEVSQPPRGCPLRWLRGSLAWPGIPRCHLVGDVCVYRTAADWEEWAPY